VQFTQASSAPNPRAPHIGHLALLLAILATALFLCVLPLAGASAPTARQGVIAQFAAYAVFLLIAWPIFTVLWKRPFLDGISWNAPGVRPWLIVFGLAVGFAAQEVETFLPVPAKMPIEQIFKTPHLIWLLLPFAVLAGPLIEEIVFRGFMLPAFANAFDWMRLPRGADRDEALANLEQWRIAPSSSLAALITSSVITSALFALVHAPQLGLSWPSVALLAGISLILCWVRLHFRSLAASTIVHCFYNLSVFVSLAITTDGFQHMNKL
jgi:membrane protease YdiL (CAAX protease family)